MESALVPVDSVTRLYGAALALGNVLTCCYWLSARVELYLDKNAAAICWPPFDTCADWRFLDSRGIVAAILVLLCVSATNAILFTKRETARSAYWLLWLSTAYKVSILAHDYRLVLNQHYMLLWVTLCFLLMPSRRQSLQYLIVLFYFWAGLLKFNQEWLSGAALYGRKPFGLPDAWIPAACYYVVVIEVAVVWGLLSTRQVIFWGSLAQLVLFHVGSFWVVGFFYPLLMFLILSIFVLNRLSLPIQVSFANLTRFRERPSTYALLCGFCVLQAIPRLQSTDSAITGEGRIFALNMFDAPVQCVATASLHWDEGVTTEAIRVPFLQPRIGCDPIVYRQAAMNLCRTSIAARPVIDVDLTLRSRRSSWESMVTIVDVKSLCSNPVGYNMFRHNPWIRAR